MYSKGDMNGPVKNFIYLLILRGNIRQRFIDVGKEWRFVNIKYEDTILKIVLPSFCIDFEQ